MRSRRLDLGLIIVACALAFGVAPGVGVSCALAQSNPTPGAPSLPLLAPAMANGVQNRITYQYGTEFVTIGATYGGAGNPAWAGDGTLGDEAIGRGSVNYEYRIGRYEITTSQWVAFMNAAYDRPPSEWLPHLRPPDAGSWGAQATTPTVPGGRRWTVPAGRENRAVGDISWRMAAMYCNWLHNDQSSAPSAFLNGAYDVSTFGVGTPFGFSDQLTHSPGAKFWIPTWDEWLKAAHFDPGKDNGPGQPSGGWWKTPVSQDTMVAYGPPGVRVSVGDFVGPDATGPLAQANAGWFNQFPGYNTFTIELGAYAATAQSPWGLLDTAGQTQEWLEEANILFGLAPVDRFTEGSARVDSAGTARAGDFLPGHGGGSPSLAEFSLGFRLAAAVPSPVCSMCLPTWLLMHFLKGRRRSTCDASSGVFSR